jgi:hypothetical protein
MDDGMTAGLGSFPDVKLEIRRGCFHVVGSPQCGRSLCYLAKYGQRPLRKMLQCSIQYTFWLWCLTDLETPDGILNLNRAG